MCWPPVIMAKDKNVGYRKVSLISSPCDGVSSQDLDGAIVPLPGVEWRMTWTSHWRKWGSGAEPGTAGLSKTLCSPSYLWLGRSRNSKVTEHWRSVCIVSARVQTKMTKLCFFFLSTVRKRALLSWDHGRRKWGQASLGLLPFALPWVS